MHVRRSKGPSEKEQAGPFGIAVSLCLCGKVHREWVSSGALLTECHHDSYHFNGDSFACHQRLLLLLLLALFGAVFLAQNANPFSSTL